MSSLIYLLYVYIYMSMLVAQSGLLSEPSENACPKLSHEFVLCGSRFGNDLLARRDSVMEAPRKEAERRLPQSKDHPPDLPGSSRSPTCWSLLPHFLRTFDWLASQKGCSQALCLVKDKSFGGVLWGFLLDWVWSFRWTLIATTSSELDKTRVTKRQVDMLAHVAWLPDLGIQLERT